MDGLFAFGSNGSGQLGIGHKEDVSVPKPVQFSRELREGDDVVKVAAGGNHTILLTRSGRALWSGDPSTGACGVLSTAVPSGEHSIGDSQEDAADDAAIFRPLCLTASAESVGVALAVCTWDSTVLVARDNEGRLTQVFALGAPGNGIVPPVESGDENQWKPLPEFPPPGTEVVDLAAGFRHVVAVLDNGEAYGWGAARKGQLGPITDGDGGEGGSSTVLSPRKIHGLSFPVARAVCCQYTSCFLADPGDGQLAVLGADKWGLQSTAPASVPDWRSVHASWGGIYVLKYDATVVAWGRDDHGQLPPPTVPQLVDLVAGSEHVLALTDSGDIIAWGWGEHGNCGPSTDTQSGDVKGRWNTVASIKNLPEGCSITALGAGCATSWINIASEGVFL